MNLYINKFVSTVFTDEELDVISDAVENLLFTEFFPRQAENMLAIHTFTYGDDDIYKILTARENPIADPDTRDFVMELWNKQFDKIFECMDAAASQEKLKDGQTLAAKIGGNAVNLRHGLQSTVATLAFECSLGMIMMSFYADNEDRFNLGCEGLVGLLKIVCRLLSKRDEALTKFISNNLVDFSFYACEGATSVLIDKTLDRWFTTDRESLKQWKAKVSQ